MSAPKRNDPFERHPSSRHSGVHYRLKKDGSKTWYFFDPARGNYVAVEGGEKDAVAAQAEARGKSARGEQVAPGKITLHEVAEAWIESKKIRAKTRRNYRESLDLVILPRFGKMKVSAITVDHIAKLVRDLEKDGKAPSTISNHLKPLSGALAFAVRRRYISSSPYDALTRDDRPAKQNKTEPHEWSDDEIAALIGAAERMAKQRDARQDYSLVIRTALYTGLRQGELLGLTWADVDFENAELRVRRQWLRDGTYGEPKTAAGVRRVPLSQDMVKRLKEWKLRSRHSADEHPVFAGRDGRPLGHRNLSRRGFEKARDLAGIEGVTFHDMRDAFASRMVSRGTDVVSLAKVMGHTDIKETLNTYSHVFDRQKADDAIREAMET
jgi:integrase